MTSGSSNGAVAGALVGILRAIFTPMRAFAACKVTLFALLTMALFAGRIVTEPGKTGRNLYIVLDDLSPLQTTLLVLLVVVLVAFNLVTFLAVMRRRDRHEQRLIALLADPNLSAAERVEILRLLE